MNKNIELKADQRRVLEKQKRDKINLKELSQGIEDHHLFGKINSDKTIPMFKSHHDYITCSQNSLSVKLRKNKEVMALASMVGFFELGTQCLREILEVKIEELNKDEK